VRTSLPRPINRVGPHTKKWARWHEKCKQAVFTRCMRQTFGNCEVTGCKHRAQDWAHLFSRGHIIAEPWASLPELTLALCRDHHNMIDRGLGGELLKALRWQAMGRLAIRFPAVLLPTGFSDPIDAARAGVDMLDRAYTYDIDKLTFTHTEAA
jgi:hypothetical protein